MAVLLCNKFKKECTRMWIEARGPTALEQEILPLLNDCDTSLPDRFPDYMHDGFCLLAELDYYSTAHSPTETLTRRKSGGRFMLNHALGVAHTVWSEDEMGFGAVGDANYDAERAEKIVLAALFHDAVEDYGDDIDAQGGIVSMLSSITDFSEEVGKSVHALSHDATKDGYFEYTSRLGRLESIIKLADNAYNLRDPKPGAYDPEKYNVLEPLTKDNKNITKQIVYAASIPRLIVQAGYSEDDPNEFHYWTESIMRQVRELPGANSDSSGQTMHGQPLGDVEAIVQRMLEHQAE